MTETELKQLIADMFAWNEGNLTSLDFMEWCDSKERERAAPIMREVAELRRIVKDAMKP
jgi:hypothetical protein